MDRGEGAETGDDSRLAAEVLISGVPKPLAYEATLGQVDIGSEVTVEVGRRQTKGWVVRTMSLASAVESFTQESAKRSSKQQLGFFQPAETTPALKKIFASAPAFLPDQLPLFHWMAEYYGVSLVDIIENAVPRRHEGRLPLLCELSDETRAKLEDDQEYRERLKKRSPVQFQILEALAEARVPRPVGELAALAKTARSALNKMAEKGLVQIFDENSLSHLFPLPEEERARSAPPSLTALQAGVVDRIGGLLDRKQFAPALLLGVTGSGKTEVYLRAIEKVLAEGGSALVIVPEIALTPQLFDQFESRLSVPPALLHSQVGPGSRWRAWENLLRGKTRVAIGARSAVFAPLNNLRLIIVDEEHESSYKQSDGLRYHARDVAVMRAKFGNATILLGSATPSFETLTNAKRGRYELLELPERVSARPLPAIEIVDLSRIKRRDMPSENLSPQLHTLIGETLEKRGQIIILYNRRGFSSFLQCGTCSEVLICPHCSVTMTFHRGKNRVLCHYCNESSSPPVYCGHCRNPRTSRIEREVDGMSEEELEAFGKLEPRGAGTEKIVDELGEQFPGARIVRLDRDTTTRKDSYRKILGSMRAGDADILVGTQMIAKGHDLPGVTLVGIIDADVGLHAPDFRSSERIYQLITQAAGRAGRGTEPGRVVVQTREPNHPTIVATVTGRFTAFARYELDYRKKLGYPPFRKLLRLIVSCPDSQDAFQAALDTRAALDTIGDALAKERAPDAEQRDYAFSVLGPAPAPHEKLRARYRWHILVKAESSRVISHVAGQMHRWSASQTRYSDLRLNVDVDPYDML